ncbi:acyl-CoA binding protein 4 [Actinidia rufa]|uniref:Acyl-CoA binding protein 4 n=1 Tax=Actinidia rufa TaxID=165716 RepID=A0A7J0FYG4_9ERIC|nr:acyl-CoA binding protein 4 [Actinidia rufa]
MAYLLLLSPACCLIRYSSLCSWHGLGNMASTEAMRLFVKILEEEDPGWYSRASNFVSDPVVDVEVNHYPKVEPVTENGNTFPETKTIPIENGSLLKTQDKDIVSDGLGSVNVYDQWVGPPVSGPRPKARYEHEAAVIDDKMYIFGGNHNGRYLNDLQVLDLRSWTWSRIEVKSGVDSLESPSPVPVPPCAGHSLIPWGTNKLLSIAGHTKDPSENMEGKIYILLKVFDLQTSTWLTLKIYGKPPVSRGGQSVTLIGTNLVVFGGQDAKRSLLNDLHILDLETMTWDEIDAVHAPHCASRLKSLRPAHNSSTWVRHNHFDENGCDCGHSVLLSATSVMESRCGVPPSPRSDHAAAVHAERYLLIFGGGSHATCFNDLHVLDLQAMEWSRPTQQGKIPSPRAGHSGVAVGENWFIVGGGDNRSGVSETVVLNMSTLVWSVVTTVQGRVPLASEGLSLVLSSYNGEDFLIAFGGYNGHYNNEVNILKPSHKSTLQSKMETPVPDSVSAVQDATNATRDVESELETGQEGKVREIIMDNVDAEPMISKSEESKERLLATIKAEKEELESSLSKEKVQSVQLKQELDEAEIRNTDLYKELQSVRGQLATEQSRCFKLERSYDKSFKQWRAYKRNSNFSSDKRLLQEQAALNEKQRQSSGGVWGWLAGTPPGQKADED